MITSTGMRQFTTPRVRAKPCPSVKVAPMKTASNERTLVAWMLYASVLFSLFACGIHHGQMSGLALSGLNGGYCSMGSGDGQGFDADGSDQTQHAAYQLNCPLCSSSSLAVAVNTADWNLRNMPNGSLSPVITRTLAQPPPRYFWPSLNPRAPPSTSYAV